MKKWFYPASLIILFIILTSVIIPAGCVYGSNTDWLSQHVTLAESIRTACLEQNTLLPSWIGLGGGSNGFQFAYYGFLRPDIILGCLFPMVPMLIIIICYMLLLYITSVLLCYVWLRTEHLNPAPAWFGSMLFMTAGCMFHMHRQIMFVNYLPFLLLAFLCIAKKKYKAVSICMLLICLHSFYFAISAFAAIGWYWYRNEGADFWRKSFFRKYIPSSALAAGMAGVLLLPTGLALLEHRSGGSSFSWQKLLELFGPNLSMNNLLFNEYGMGLSMICFFALLISLMHKRFRKDSILFLLLGLFGAFSWILNGTLYARPKVLIPFMPLLILHCVRCLSFRIRLWQNKNIPLPVWPFSLMILLGIGWTLSGQPQGPWSLAETGVLLALCLLSRKTYSGAYRTCTHLPGHFLPPVPEMSGIQAKIRVRRLVYLILAIAPIGMYAATSGTEDWVLKTETTAGLTAEDLAEIQFDPLYHFDSLFSPLVSGNERTAGYTRSTMYSSVTNQSYSGFYYDTLLTPIRINNRVALLTSDNPFLLQALGVRYLETDSSHIPSGYEVITRNKTGDIVIAENKNVPPMAYFTSDTVSQNWFDQLEPLEKLDIITRKTVVDETSSNNSQQPVSGDTQTANADETGELKADARVSMEDFTPELTVHDIPEGLHIEHSEGGYEIRADQECTLQVSIDNPAPDHILLLNLDVENLTRQAVVIDINAVRNKLSNAFAAYPNGNSSFHYQFSPDSEYDSGQGVNTLEITFFPGHYKISGINWHLYDQTLLTAKEYTPLTSENDAVQDTAKQAADNVILSGTVTADASGYLATSIPRQNGLQIYVDGELQEMITINEAFAGTALTEGTHQIDIRFTPPGKTAGLILSLISTVGYIMWISNGRLRLVLKHNAKYSKGKKESL